MSAGLVWPQCRVAGAAGHSARSLGEQPAPASTCVRASCAAPDRWAPAKSVQGYGCSRLGTLSASPAVGTVLVRASMDRITGE